MRHSPLLASIASGLAFLPLAALRHHPHDVIDCLELSPTFPTDHTVFATSDGTLNLVARSVNGGFTWSDVRSGLTGKHVYAMALAEDFERSGRAYVALGNDGLAWTKDHGTTWHPAPRPTKRDPAVLAALPFAGDAAPVLFYGTTIWSASKGLFRTSDPGVDDVELDPQRFRTHLPTCLAATRAGASVVVFAATDDGRLHRSEDRGSTWTTLSLTGDVRRIALSPRFAQDRTLWLATFKTGVVVSRDGGSSFTPCNEGLADLDVNDVAVPARWPECRELFAATRDAGLFQSKDGGDHWELTSLRVTKTYQTDNHHRFVRLPADYPATPAIYCGTFEGVHFSIDGGATWIKSNMNPTRFGRRILLSPDFARDRTVFTSGYGMLLATSEDAGSSWTFGAQGVRALSSYALAVAPTWKDEGLLILGINEGIWRSTDRGATWNKLEMPPFKRPEGPRQDHDITQVVFSPHFAEDRTCVGVSNGGVYLSTDAAQSFRCLAPPVEYSIEVAITPDFPSDPTIVVGGSRLKRSTDLGETWSDELVNSPVSGVVCAPDWTTSGEVYAWSSYVGFLRSKDRGASFQPSNDGLRGHLPTSVRLSPRFARDGTMFMTTFGGGLHRSTDRGLHWQRHGSRDPRLDHATALALSPAFVDDRTLFLGTFDGVWRSTDGGESFVLTTTRELYDEAREPWVWIKKWGRFDRAGAFGGTVDQTRYRGHEARFPFVGTGFRLFGTRGPDHGKAALFVDGRLAATLDSFAAQPADSAVLFEEWKLPWGYHELTLHVLGEKSDEASDTLFGIDAAELACVGRDDEVPVFVTR